ncbi:MAG: TonB-dependent receptor [Dysgonamonadaceae bacterium]|jgi:outer membrane receptor protein involved in Fe transport|nr:TonB-dependent receptor [Dysgonamonadaceae bacterium]
MKKNIIIGLLFTANLFGIQAENRSEIFQDTIQSKYLDEIIVSGFTKETNPVKTLPGSVTFITPQMIEGQKIVHIKDLSLIIPNFFIPDYGSKLSVPVYIRGIGERSTGQSIGMYVDNMPYQDKSVFDFDFMDISRIEVLRGPQGTLYGRNAMSGIVNIATYSPLQSQYKKVSLSVGNYGFSRAKISAAGLLAQNIGVSVNGYYDKKGGYFTNRFDGRRADSSESSGAKIRLDWKIDRHWTAQWMANYDASGQGAFPYGEYVNGTIAMPNYNDPGNYDRKIAGSYLNLKFENESLLFNSTTGFQYFDDDMKMDVDNSARDIFKLNQWQKAKSWTEELTLKSNAKNNYQWSFGIFGFYTDLETNVVTTMGTDGIKTIMQPVFDKIYEENKDKMPPAPKFEVVDSEIPIPGLFKTPAYGGAVYHQSTYNNLFTDGLSVTAGIRLDYEKNHLDYNTNLSMKLNGTIMGRPMGIVSADTVLIGKKAAKFTEILPKIGVKYEFNPENYIYATITNGYKTGGYNIQNFADIIQNEIRRKYDEDYDKTFPPLPVVDRVSYQPEYSWNYEIGFKGELVKNFLYTELAAFYIDVKDIQITDFVESGQGRILKNAGKAGSAGFDLSVTALLSEAFKFTANYGFTRAVFKDYVFKDKDSNPKDYTGNFIPFAPQNTLSAIAVYNKTLRNKRIDRFYIQAQYNCAGKIYWTEANDVYQNFYGLLNLRAGVGKRMFGINIWADNVFNMRYTAFYFESMQQKLAQAGKPFTFGVEANISF